MAAKPYRPKMTAAEKKAYKNRNFGVQGKTGGMGGGYGRKSTNLTQKQLKAAGAAKAAKKRTVDISQTRREGAVTLGPGGKPLTGTVNLGGGKTAVYKGGKRVQKSVAAPKPKARGGATTTAKPKAKIPTTRVSPSARGEGSKPKVTAAQAKRMGSEGPKRPMPQLNAKKVTMNANAGRWDSQVKVQRVPAKNYTSQPKNPNIGDTWTQKYPNGRTIKRKYTAGGWRVTK